MVRKTLTTCRRCGLPRRRQLLTPDGKTFSFPGFAVRRHRGLLLASGAALCCCCVDIPPTSNGATQQWDSGQDFSNVDEWPSDDASTYATVAIPILTTRTVEWANGSGADGDYKLLYSVRMTSVSSFGVSIEIHWGASPAPAQTETITQTSGNNGTWIHGESSVVTFTAVAVVLWQVVARNITVPETVQFDCSSVRLGCP